MGWLDSRRLTNLVAPALLLCFQLAMAMPGPVVQQTRTVPGWSLWNHLWSPVPSAPSAGPMDRQHDPRPLSLEDLPLLALEKIRHFLALRDQISFGLLSRAHLSPSLDPRSEDRQGIRRECGQELENQWLSRYFYEPRNPLYRKSDPSSPHRLSPVALELDLEQSSVRHLFFQPLCLQALSNFCLHDRHRWQGSGGARMRIQLGRVSLEELYLLKTHFSQGCSTELRLRIAGVYERMAFYLLVLQRTPPRQQPRQDHQQQLTLNVVLEDRVEEDISRYLKNLLAISGRALRYLCLAELKDVHDFERVLLAIHRNGNLNTLHIARIPPSLVREHISVLSASLARNLPVQRLFLLNLNMDSGMAGPFLDALSQNSHLHLLSLAFGRIPLRLVPEQAMRALCCTSCSLQQLDLRGCNLDAMDVAVLAAALRSSHTLRNLDLSENDIRTEGIIAIADALEYHPTLQSLSISKTVVEQAASIALSHMFFTNRQLRRFSMTNMWFSESPDILLEGLHQNPSLRVLDISGNRYGDSGAQALAALLRVNVALTHLIARDEMMSADGISLMLEALANNPQSPLRSLDLGRNRMGVELGELPWQWHHLFFPRKTLADVTQLQTLILDGNEMDDEAALSLLEQLLKNRSLKHVFLRDNDEISSGMKAKILAMLENRVQVYLK